MIGNQHHVKHLEGHWLFSLVLVSLWLSGERVAGAKENATCQKWVQQKQYRRAAGCFLKTFEQSKGVGRQGSQRIAVGRRLRNAAIAFQLAAKTEPRPAKRSFLYERGVQLLTTYLDGKWFENRYRKDSALLLRQKWRGKIGYATLTVVMSPKDRQYTLRGYKSVRTLRGTWSGAVRPGSYVISYQIPGQPKRRQKRLQVHPGKARVIVIKALAAPLPGRRAVVARAKPRRAAPVARRTLPVPKPRSGVVVAGWAILGVGVAAAVIGSGLWIGARFTEGQKSQGYERLRGDLSQAKAADTQALIDMDQQAKSLQAAGIGTLVGGGVMVAVGVVVALITRPSTPVHAPKSPQGKAGLTRARLLEGQTF